MEKRTLFLVMLLITSLLFSFEKPSLEDLKAVLGYRENVNVQIETLITGETGRFLRELIAKEGIVQKDTGWFDSSLISAINEGWSTYSSEQDPKSALYLYLEFYDAVFRKLSADFSLFGKDLYILYLNNLSTFLWVLGYVKHAKALNDLLFSHIDMCKNMIYKSYIYINRAVRKVEDGDFIAATHYFFLAYLNNSSQREDILQLRDIRNTVKREEYKECKYFELLKILLLCPSVNTR